MPLTVEIADNFMTGKNIAFDRVSRKIKWLDTSCKIQILIPLVLLNFVIVSCNSDGNKFGSGEH